MGDKTISREIAKEKIRFLTNCVVALHNVMVGNNDYIFDYIVKTVEHFYKVTPVSFDVMEIFAHSTFAYIDNSRKNNIKCPLNVLEERSVYDKYLGNGNYDIPFIENKQAALESYYYNLPEDLLDSIIDLQQSTGAIFDGSDDTGEFTEYCIKRVAERMAKHNIALPIRHNG